MNLDTQAFNAALEEFREENPYAQDRDFWALLLEDRMAIMRVAQLKKEEMISNFLDVDRHESAPVSDGFTDQRDEDEADQEYCDRAAGRV